MSKTPLELLKDLQETLVRIDIGTSRFHKTELLKEQGLVHETNASNGNVQALSKSLQLTEKGRRIAYIKI